MLQVSIWRNSTGLIHHTGVTEALSLYWLPELLASFEAVIFNCCPGCPNCQPVQNPFTLYCPQAYPPPILSNPMHAHPLFYTTPCIPSPYSIPAHACPPPILSQSMHALPLFYPTLCIPSSYSLPAPTSHPSILFYSSPCMSS